MTYLENPLRRAELRDFYHHTLVDDVMPFWLRHGLDPEYGGIMTCLDRDGSLIDTDKSVWFQGRAGWMFGTMFNRVDAKRDYLEAAGSCVDFLDEHGYATDGKLFFTLTREGKPLRMRRYVFSEAFAAIAHAAYSKVKDDHRYHEAALRDFARYLRISFEPGLMMPKINSETRPMIGLAPLMIGIVTAQELRANLGRFVVSGHTATEWIDRFIMEIQQMFWKPELGALMEVVGPQGGIIDHADGRQLNPGHAIECAWFILHEGKLRNERSYVRLGLQILDAMWERGWDAEHGGLFYFRDLHHKPVLEYWQDMKFWWPHCEALIATALAYELTQEPKYAQWHAEVHDWSFRNFPDAQHGEWFGWLHRDGTPSQMAKGSLFKGPFHLPRALLYLSELLNPK